MNLLLLYNIECLPCLVCSIGTSAAYRPNRHCRSQHIGGRAHSTEVITERVLQKDLDTLVKWSKTWGMMFNIKKCNVISITNATKKNKIQHQYTVDNEPLNSIDSCVYLGVTVNSRLRWNQHIDQISAAANRM